MLTLTLAQAFEWVVRDVHRLRDYIENPEVSGELAGESEGEAILAETDEFEILKEAPIIGDGKFKLEIGTSVHSLCAIQHSCATRSQEPWPRHFRPGCLLKQAPHAHTIPLHYFSHG